MTRCLTMAQTVRQACVDSRHKTHMQRHITELGGQLSQSQIRIPMQTNMKDKFIKSIMTLIG